MIPTVGRIIHLQQGKTDPPTPCRAAIVTGLDHLPTRQFYATVFSPHRAEVTVCTIKLPSFDWHDPRECPLVQHDKGRGGE